MAESSSEPAAAADLLIEQNKDDPAGPAGSISKELIVTTTTEGPGPAPGSDVGAEVPSTNGATDSPLPAKVFEEEATPTPPDTSSLSSENDTVTAVTTEEESLSVLLKHIKTEGGQDREGEPGKQSDQVQNQLIDPAETVGIISGVLLHYFSSVRFDHQLMLADINTPPDLRPVF